MQYGYDANNQVASIPYRNGVTTIADLTYAYDAAGRRIAIGGTWARTGLPQAVASATYDAANELTAWGSQARQFDANGGLASGGLTSYVWDSRQRLSGMNGPSDAIFSYDATGRRVATTLRDVTTQYSYDGLNVVSENRDGLTTAVPARRGLDKWVARLDASGSMFFLSDALGSPVAMSDYTGTPVTQYTYDPFGAAIAQGATNDAFRFTGRERRRD